MVRQAHHERRSEDLKGPVRRVVPTSAVSVVVLYSTFIRAGRRRPPLPGAFVNHLRAGVN